MKPSRYNHFFKQENGSILAYNAFSNSLAAVTPEKYSIIQDILENKPRNQDPSMQSEYDSLTRDLIRGGYIVDDCVDEFEILKAKSHIARFSNDILALTIAPVSLCNFSCVYCFETRKTDVMNIEVQDAIIDFFTVISPSTHHDTMIDFAKEY